jgi:nucleoside-diphosphate-sugar epimerase
MTKISILGCGWLGFPLAKKGLQKGFSVKGSTTSIEKISLLENDGIQAFLISLESKTVKGPIDDFLHESEILIIDIPPKLRGNSNDVRKTYVEKIETLIPFLMKSTVSKILFISSTSVYSEDSGIVTEKTIPIPFTEAGKQLLEVETLLKNNSKFETTILRFGGLIGADRNPARFLAGKENLENPDAPINLIHQEDCIEIILKIIEKNSWNETFNAVAPFHPSREKYYTQKAAENNLVLPKFNHSKPSLGKTIDSTKLEAVLMYTFTQLNL